MHVAHFLAVCFVTWLLGGSEVAVKPAPKWFSCDNETSEQKKNVIVVWYVSKQSQFQLCFYPKPRSLGAEL